MWRYIPFTETAHSGKKAPQRMPGEAGEHYKRESRGVRLPYLPGLDGLRALAVIAVLIYHADLGWLSGGFLGVDVFFVISGYLITSLLVAEWRERGRIDLKAFWMGRARRLLPALYLLLAVTLAFAVLFLPGEVARLRSDALAAFTYVTNWYLIFDQQSYFETVGRPSLLKHLWSLAIEEQFYVLWPLVLAAGISMGALLWRRRLLLVTLAGAAASTLLMAVLYRPDIDPSWLYYRTDTRAAALLIGAALAFVWAPGRVRAPKHTDSSAARYRRPGHIRRFRHRWAWTTPRLLDFASLAALGGLVWFCFRLDEFQPFLYQGGFALVALVTAALIMVVVHPRTTLGAGLLELGLLRWVGLRSYGIYLWHWPVFMVTRPQLDVPIDGLPLLALRLAATVALAALSYRFVETPIRRGALGRAWRKLHEAHGDQRRRLRVRWAGVVVPGMALCVTLGVAVAYAKPPAPPPYLDMEAIHTDTPASETAATSEAARPVPASGQAEGAAAPQTAPTVQTAPATQPASAGPVTAIGDSVMLGAAWQLEQDIPNLYTMDAAVSLQVSAAIPILHQRSAAGQLGDVVVVHLGNNGTFTAQQFDEMMQVLADVDKVIFVNNKVPRPWEQPNNEVLASGVQRYPNAVLVDWNTASAYRPELFWEDGIHLRPEGQQLYADLIVSHL